MPSDNLMILEGEYSTSLVVLSIVIACVAAYTALTMNERVKNNSFFNKNFWFTLASFALGSGIWAMHYVGMFAFRLPVKIEYDILLTVISVIPAFFATFLAFYFVNYGKLKLWFILTTSVVMGLGVSSMHYIGMASMITEAKHTYDPWFFSASILISFLAFVLFALLNRFMHIVWFRIVSSVVMGLIISSMHYVGMYAVTFYIRADYKIANENIPVDHVDILVFYVIIGMILLLGSLLISSVGDRYIEFRAKNYDTVTKLPNHRLFEENLKKTLYNQVAIWYLPDFEEYNRKYGYQFGDIVLQRLIDIFEENTSPSIEIYRVERNRFAFLSKKTAKEKSLYGSMEEIARILEYPLAIQNEQFVISAVCSVAVTTGYKKSLDTYADALAVLNFPNIPYNREVIQYDSSIHKLSFERDIVDGVGKAMRDDELFLVYQPKIYGHTKKIAGLEVLIRWNHPTYGFLNPGVFISILEKNDRMIVVTDWIIEKVCQQIGQWREQGLDFGKVSVNIPGHYVTSPHLLDVLHDAVAKHNISPEQVELEITETSFVKNMEEAMRAVSAFRQEGFAVALDDFGTGVSSLSYLKQMAISTLKIDRSFVTGIPMSEKDSAIIKAIIALGGSLGLEIVIEGIETKEQVDFLNSICNNPIIQGFYFSKPLPPDELVAWNVQYTLTQGSLVTK